MIKTNGHFILLHEKRIFWKDTQQHDNVCLHDELALAAAVNVVLEEEMDEEDNSSNKRKKKKKNNTSTCVTVCGICDNKWRAS